MALNFPSSPSDGDVYAGFQYDSAVTAWRSSNPFADTLPAGTIVQWAGTSAPGNWLICDGSAVSRSTYAALYAVIGIIYGAGDGSTTFNLPDLRGRVPVGKNSGTFSVLGGAGGAETHTLTIAEIPSHTHGQSRGNDNNLGSGATQYGWQATDDKAGDYQTYPTGGGGAHNNLQPYQVVNYIIKTTYGTTPGMSQAEVNLSGYDARLTTAETVAATTNKSGLVPLVPSSVVINAGASSINSSGAVTFAGVNTFTLYGLFSAAYTNYKVVIEHQSATTAQNTVYMQLVKTSDSSIESSAYAGSRRWNGYSSAATTTSNLDGYYNSTSWMFIDSYNPGTQGQFSELTLYRPYKNAATGMKYASEVWENNATVWLYSIDGGGVLNTTTSYSGLRVSVANSAALTGTISVYGIRS